MRQACLDDLEGAIARFGPGDWLDLSTGLNRRPWLAGAVPPLPQAPCPKALARAAADWLGCDPAQVLPVADPLAAVLRLPPGRVSVLGCGIAADRLSAAGWAVRAVPDLAGMAGADMALVANPASPDGRAWGPGALAELARTVRCLVVDEGLADPRPDLSLAPMMPANALILRDLRPFWGLPGLGLVLGNPARMAGLADPRPVDDHILGHAALALADRHWADDMVLYLTEATLRLDRIGTAAGWRVAGGTHLFRLYDTGNARTAQDRLARAHVWTHRVPGSDALLRLDIPARAEWDRIRAGLRGFVPF